MYFSVISHPPKKSASVNSRAYLLIDNWDDYFEFSTLYSLVIFDDLGLEHVIGGVKIGQFGMAEDQRRPDIPGRFDRLGERFFSLGQDDSYYDDLNKLGAATRDRVLRGLRDVALDLPLFERALRERVTGISLLRFVSLPTVRGQFHRMARGGARLSRYEFSYTAPPPDLAGIDPLALQFVVDPESFPPTNVHVLIGRNGVGKTTVLDKMSRAIVEKSPDRSEVGAFSAEADEMFGLEDQVFTNLVSVTFSAFDRFEPPPNRQDKSKGVQYAYIGLRRVGSDVPKSPDTLSTDFALSALVCRQGARAGRWLRALETLEADPIFKDTAVTALAVDDLEPDALKVEARRLFKELSSGHKIVLLTITRLVETVEEKTLVLLDEPEAHLHPPLLAAFVRALSDLLINRNGVAVIATHSPVVLQEVPKSCVWKIRRAGAQVVADRPDIETFGENVGILTREIFGLEVTDSGFHKMLRDAVAQNPEFDAVVRSFGGELGGEARAIVRGLLAARDPDDEVDF